VRENLYKNKNMIKEFSAGGIVYKKSKIKDQKSKLNVENDVLWLVAQHSQHKGWVFPKGFIGDKIAGETKENTAVREVEEETGVKGKILIELSKPAGYFYVFKGEKRYKTVYYFLMKYVKGDITKHDFEMSTVEWWPTEKVKRNLTYKSDKIAFTEALKLYADIIK
jgi:ADP-ribose pyrophosphatase YjhB (NUDIX family)